MGAKSRQKGAGAEREFASKLGDLVGEPELLRRNLEQTRSGGDDLQVIPGNYHNPELVSRLDGFSIEIKRHAKAPPSAVKSWWHQAVRQSVSGLQNCFYVMFFSKLTGM